MHSLTEALAHLADYPLALPATETIPILAAVGRISSQNVSARYDQPPFDGSMMDGYAVSASTTPSWREVAPSAVLPAGQAQRIFTGKPIPAGCHSVIAQEDISLEAGQLRAPALPPTGQHIRRRASELAAGQVLLTAGQRIKTLDMALLCAQGITELAVYRPLRVGVMSCGDELVTPPAPLLAGQIYDSNRWQLLALLHAQGVATHDLGVLPDDPLALEAALSQAVTHCDMVISSAGSSVGEHDYIRTVLAKLGQVHYWQLAIKPGKPFAFGQIKEKPFFALPGNPVAAVVTFLLLAQPFITRASGALTLPPQLAHYPLRQGQINKGPRQLFLRGHLVEHEGRVWVQAFAQQESADLFTLSKARVLIDIPAHSTVEAGTLVSCYLLPQ